MSQLFHSFTKTVERGKFIDHQPCREGTTGIKHSEADYDLQTPVFPTWQTSVSIVQTPQDEILSS